MMGQRQFETTLYYQLSLDRLVPQDHLLRRLVAAVDFSFVEANEERLASPLGKQRLIERQIYSEGAFGLAKELHGLRRTRFKGRWRVQIQLWLTVAAINIKKAVRSIAASPRTGGAPLLLTWLRSLLSLGGLLAPSSTHA